MPGPRQKFSRINGGKAPVKPSAAHIRDNEKPAPATHSKPAKPATPIFGAGVKLAGITHPHMQKSAPPAVTAATITGGESLISMEDDEEHFVRGRSGATKSSSSTSHTPRDTDTLFSGVKRKAADSGEENEDKKSKNKKQKKAKKDAKKSAGSEDEENVSGKDNDEESEINSATATTATVRRIESLNRRSLQPGLTVLGAIERVTDLEAIVSLPNGFVGHLALREVSTIVADTVDKFLASESNGSHSGKKKRPTELPRLSQFVRVGQLWPVSVLSTQTSTAQNRIELSLRPSLINSHLTSAMLGESQNLIGTIQSVEEKGYIVDIGISDSNIKGFLSFKDAPIKDILGETVTGVKAESTTDGDDSDDDNSERRLMLGQPLVCQIKRLTPRSIVLTAVPDKVFQHTSKINANQHYLSLLPGALYRLTVSEASLYGLHCECANISASIDITNLPAIPPQGTELKSLPLTRSGSVLSARLLYVNKKTKIAAFTLAKHLVADNRGLVGASLSMGDFVDAHVLRIEGKSGVWFHCRKMDRDLAVKKIHNKEKHKQQQQKENKSAKKEEEDNEAMEDDSDSTEHDDESSAILGFGPYKFLSDDPIANVLRKFPYQSRRIGRVIAVDTLNAMVRLSFQHTQLSKKIVSITDLRVGDEVTGTIASIESYGMLVQLATQLKGLIPNIHLADISMSQSNSAAKRFRVGKQIKARILNLDTKNKRIILTIKPTLLSSKYLALTAYEAINTGDLCHGFIASAKSNGLVIEFYNHVHGLVSAKSLVRDGLIGEGGEEKIIESWNKGDTVTVRVLTVQPTKKKLYLSLKLKPDPVDEEKKRLKRAEAIEVDDSTGRGAGDSGEKVKSEPLVIGAILNGHVTKVIPSQGLLVSLHGHHSVAGMVHVTDMADQWSNTVWNDNKTGARVRVKVLNIVDSEDGKKRIDLSMKQSDIDGTPSLSSHSVTDAKSLEAGSLVDGFIKQTGTKGCFVWLSRTLIGRVLIKDLSDRRVENPVTSFPSGRYVRARVESVDTDHNHVNLSLRRSTVSARPQLALDDLTMGAKVKGEVKSVKSFGVFIRINHSQLDGLAHISECSDDKIEDLTQHYKTGDRVRAVVVKIDPATKKISLGLKAKYFEDESEEERQAAQLDSEPEEEEDLKESVAPSVKAASPAVKPLPRQSPALNDAAAAAPVMDDFDSAPSLNLTAAVAADEDEDIVMTEPVTAKSKRAIKKAAHESVEERELSLMDPTAAPTTAADFDRLILASPNSSIVYIQYMAYHLERGDVAKARAIGERALATIAYREEGERRNVWLALISLEHTHGTESSTQAVVDRACQRSDPKLILLEVATIYAKSNHVDRAVNVFQKLVKNHGEEKNVWVSYAKFLYDNNRIEDGRALLTQAVSKLHTSHHIELMEKFAKLESTHLSNGGSMERARTMFESLIHQHSKRVDIINVFVDLEMQYLRTLSSPSEAKKLSFSLRQLFERVTDTRKHNWSSKKMKFLLKRFLEFEQEFGDAKRIELVKQRAREYVDAKSGERETDE